MVTLQLLLHSHFYFACYHGHHLFKYTVFQAKIHCTHICQRTRSALLLSSSPLLMLPVIRSNRLVLDTAFFSACPSPSGENYSRGEWSELSLSLCATVQCNTAPCTAWNCFLSPSMPSSMHIERYSIHTVELFFSFFSRYFRIFNLSFCVFSIHSDGFRYWCRLEMDKVAGGFLSRPMLRDSLAETVGRYHVVSCCVVLCYVLLFVVIILCCAVLHYTTFLLYCIFSSCIALFCIRFSTVLFHSIV
jgi:hypothetical protein